MIDVINDAQTVLDAVIPNPSPDVIDALVNAKRPGVYVGVIISPDPAIQRKLRRLGVAGWVGDTEMPFVAVDAPGDDEVFVYGQTVNQIIPGVLPLCPALYGPGHGRPA